MNTAVATRAASSEGAAERMPACGRIRRQEDAALTHTAMRGWFLRGARLRREFLDLMKRSGG